MDEVLKRLRSLLPGMWRYRWHSLVLAIIVGSGGATLAMLVPNQFEAGARVYVDTQSILKPLMAGLAIQPNIDQQVQMIAKTLISRPNVERVIRMADLDQKTKGPEERELLIDALIRQIDFRLVGGNNNMYSIAYRSTTPEQARKVVQSLLSIFVETNLGDKRRDGAQAKRFIDEQIGIYENRLVEAEAKLKDFKIRNVGMMPNLAQDYVTRSAEAQKELNSARLELRQTEGSRDALRRELALEAAANLNASAAARAAEQAERAAVAEIVPTPRANDQESRLELARRRLADMLVIFTDDHPQVIAMRRTIEQMEEQIQSRPPAREPAANATAPPPTTARVVAPAQVSNTAYQAIRSAIADAEAKAAALRARVASAEADVVQARKLSETIPKIEAQYTQLTREYDTTKKSYEQLLTRRESAEMSGNMDSSASLAEFRVIDPPRALSRPVFPNRPFLLIVALLASIAAALALALVRDLMSPAFFDVSSLQRLSKRPIFGVVSIYTDKSKRWRQRWASAAFASGASLYVALFVTGIAWVAYQRFSS